MAFGGITQKQRLARAVSLPAYLVGLLITQGPEPSARKVVLDERPLVGKLRKQHRHAAAGR